MVALSLIKAYLGSDVSTCARYFDIGDKNTPIISFTVAETDTLCDAIVP
jgi:hypothetical protein